MLQKRQQDAFKRKHWNTCMAKNVLNSSNIATGNSQQPLRTGVRNICICQNLELPLQRCSAWELVVAEVLLVGTQLHGGYFLSPGACFLSSQVPVPELLSFLQALIFAGSKLPVQSCSPQSNLLINWKWYQNIKYLISTLIQKRHWSLRCLLSMKFF